MLMYRYVCMFLCACPHTGVFVKRFDFFVLLVGYLMPKPSLYT